MFIPSFLEALLGGWGEGEEEGNVCPQSENQIQSFRVLKKWAISLLIFFMSLVASLLRPCHLSEFDRNRASILVCPSQPCPQGSFPWLLKRPGDEFVYILKTDKENWLKNGSNSFQVSFIEMSIRSGGPSCCYSIILFLFSCLLNFLFHERLHVVSKIQTCYPLRLPGRFILSLLMKWLLGSNPSRYFCCQPLLG